jgi:hypothetical protein
MGYGAYVTVTNNNPADVRLYVHGIVCMYDDGKEGSNPSYFNGLEVVSGATEPSDGQGQYVEAIASGQCIAEGSTFTLDVNQITEGDQQLIGSLLITEQFNKYYDKPTGAVEAVINNGEDQATIQVTVT